MTNDVLFKAHPTILADGILDQVDKLTDEEEAHSLSNHSTLDEAQDLQLPHGRALQVPERRRAERLYHISLQAVDCSFGIVSEGSHGRSLQRVVRRQLRQQAADVAVVFCVRRPGCGGCREHGAQLSELAASDQKMACLGIVKETGVDDEGLLEFYNDYFHYPLYKDAQWNVYRCMGGRQLGWRDVVTGWMRSFQRHQKKGIRSTRGGEGFWQGGVLLLDRHGLLRYYFAETYGEELPMEQIRASIEEIRCEAPMDGADSSHHDSTECDTSSGDGSER